MLTEAFRKSRHSDARHNCVEARWRKSSHSAFNGNCTEARLAGAAVQVRDSQLGEDSPVLAFTPAAWDAFLCQLKA